MFEPARLFLAAKCVNQAFQRLCVPALVSLGEASIIDKRDKRVETQTLFHTQSGRSRGGGELSAVERH